MATLSRHTRTSSPPLSTASSQVLTTVGQQQQRLNVVTRLAIQGKAKQGEAGASIRVYIKMSLPMDSVSAGSTIPLFAEENVKILASQVHPIDNNSVPYNFSSTTSPLLHSAARALNLPARSSKSYLLLFGLPTSSSYSYSSSSTNTGRSTASQPNGIHGHKHTQTLDDKYTGHILVSGYNVSYVLPKEFPPRFKDDISNNGATTGSFRRRPSISDKGYMHFMAAIELWVPYLSKPPRAPYLLSIPIPRCLSNTVKLRIFPPTTTATTQSFASLSSAEDDPAAAGGGSWELASDPHVTRSTPTSTSNPIRTPSRSNSHGSFADADDESSDSGMGCEEGCGIQGTFPSTDRIRVRWAAPSKSVDVGGIGRGGAGVGAGWGCEDGRRRVGVREVKGEMTCVVLGRGVALGSGKERRKEKGAKEGVMMRVEYKGTCKGVWFGGVATMLGMDVGLEAKGSDVAWVRDVSETKKWAVGGGTGYTGFDTGSPLETTSTPKMKKKSSFPSHSHSPEIFVSPSSPDGRASSFMVSRQSSTSSTASLLRAPLPSANVADYSFEGGSTPSLAASGTMSSIGSLPQGTDGETGETRPPSANGAYNDIDAELDANADTADRPPAVPLTIHINMNDLLPPSKNVFTFTISGTIILTPRQHRSSSSYGGSSGSSSPSSSSGGENQIDPEFPITLPKFTVFTADAETTSIMVRNEAGSATVEVYNVAGDLRHAQTRKTVLQKGGLARCGTEGARIALKSIVSTYSRIKREGEEHDAPNGRVASPGRPRTPNGNIPRVASASHLRQTYNNNNNASAMVTTMTLARPIRDGPLMIPNVDVTVTPLLSGDALLPNAYAVRMCLPAPTDANSEWLEFGLAQPSPVVDEKGGGTDGTGGTEQPRVDIASASVEGVPVRFETSALVKQEQNDLGNLGVPFEEMSGKEWISWVRVHVGTTGGDRVQVDYVVKSRDKEEAISSKRKGKRKVKDGATLDIFLPTFQLPVGRLVVNVDSDQGLQISSLRSNLTHQQCSTDGPRLLHYSLEELFYPRLSLVIHRLNLPHYSSAERSVLSTIMQSLMWTGPPLLSCVLLFCILSLGAEFRQMQRSLETCSTILGSGWEADIIPETKTVTSTILASEHAKWWFGDATSSETSVYITQSSSATPTDVGSTHVPSNTLPITTQPVSQPEMQALAMANDMLFPWLLKHDLLDDARATLDTVLRSLGKVWRICIRIYHYPLDPS